ncbi:hypothetical protein Y032_0084g1761 [Ancylostoma ceylanicum]|uniref:Uncharacterized protein n=1 Tax=Ancylostoma ceylanicum TaxID=53326 RepID=A0A016TR27_9BILA|nr:hypothetical protein Y032_0084g1761 [Ancylostoma ceylanicum]
MHNHSETVQAALCTTALLHPFHSFYGIKRGLKTCLLFTTSQICSSHPDSGYGSFLQEVSSAVDTLLSLKDEP